MSHCVHAANYQARENKELKGSDDLIEDILQADPGMFTHMFAEMKPNCR